jgi:hypothetical protein
LLTRSDLTHPEVSSVVFLGSFRLLECRFYQSGLSVTWHSIYMLHSFSLVVLHFVQDWGY